MRNLSYEIVNVFAETYFGGNPLAVFPNADGVSDIEMQQIAKQFNLSETVFTKQVDINTVALRIFTPSCELRFAGHPILGASSVINRLNSSSNLVVNTLSKTVNVNLQEGRFFFDLNGYATRKSEATLDELSAITGLSPNKFSEKAYWVNTGSPHLLLHVSDVKSLERVDIDLKKLQEISKREDYRPALYLWCELGEIVHARFFSEKYGYLFEDSGTGSAATNLGAYFSMIGKYPLQREIYQGDYIGRPNRIVLNVDEEETISIGASVIKIAEGNLRLP